MAFRLKHMEEMGELMSGVQKVCQWVRMCPEEKEKEMRARNNLKREKDTGLKPEVAGQGRMVAGASLHRMLRVVSTFSESESSRRFPSHAQPGKTDRPGGACSVLPGRARLCHDVLEITRLRSSDDRTNLQSTVATVPVLLYYCTCTTVPVLLYSCYCTTVPGLLYYCTTVLLYYCTCTTVPVLLYYCTTVPVRLYYCLPTGHRASVTVWYNFDCTVEAYSDAPPVTVLQHSTDAQATHTTTPRVPSAASPLRVRERNKPISVVSAGHADFDLVLAGTGSASSDAGVCPCSAKRGGGRVLNSAHTCPPPMVLLAVEPGVPLSAGRHKTRDRGHGDPMLRQS
eukprot:1653611-Rhodomonas_salina.3